MMKLPKTFVPDKNLKKDLEKLLHRPKKEENPEVLQELMMGAKAYFSREKKLGMEQAYETALEIAENIDYSQEDIKSLGRIMVIPDYLYLGIYFSALVNNISNRNSVIELKFQNILSGLGLFMKEGTLIIDGDAGYDTGCFMTGGKIIVKGNTSRAIGPWSEGGEIHLEGKYETLGALCQSRIYQRGKLIHPK